VLNQALCGAKNVVGNLRWLKSGETYKADAGSRHQLVYLMEGKGRIKLNNKDYDVNKGAGVYLAPTESAAIQASDDKLKLFILVVPKIPK
jgi:quercetin dioxygenase-like cupin family protein